VNPGGGVLGASAALVAMLALRTALHAGRRASAARRLRPASPGAAGRGSHRLPAPPAALVRRLRQAGLAVDPAAVWTGWLATLAAAVPAGLVAGGPGLALVAGLAVVAAPAVAAPVVAGRADRLVEDALPDALEGIARCLRSGAALRQAVEEVGGSTPGLLGTDVATVAADVAQGRGLADALEAWGRRRPLPGVRLAVSALALGAETGGAHARAIDGVAATVRSRQAVNREVRALSSQARLSGMVIVLAPLGFSALAAATDEGTAGFLLRTPTGLVCLVAGITLDVLAALWMMRLSRIDI